MMIAKALPYSISRWTSQIFGALLALAYLSTASMAFAKHEDTTLGKAERNIRILKLSEDRKWAFSFDRGNNLTTWDLTTKKQSVLKTKGISVRNAAVSPDGSWVTMTNWFGSTFAIWQRGTLSLTVVKTSLRRVKSMLFVAKDKVLLAGYRSVVLFDLKTKKSTPQDELTFSGGALSPDLKTIAIFEKKGGVTLRDAATLKAQGKLPLTEKVSALTWSADGNTIVAGGASGTLILLEKKGDAWTITKTLTGHTVDIKSIAFLSPTKLVSGARKLVVWDIAQGGPIEVSKLGWGYEAKFSYLGNNQLLYYKSSKVIRRKIAIDAKAKVIPSDAQNAISASSPIRAFAWFPNGPKPRIAAVDRSRNLYVAEVSTGKQPTQAKQVGSLSFSPQQLIVSPDGKSLLLNTYRKSTFGVWDLATKQLRWVKLDTTQFPESVKAMAFVQQGKVLAVGGAKGSLVLLSWPSAKIVRKINIHARVYSLHVAGKRGQWLLVNEGFRGKTLVLHDLENKKIKAAVSQFANIIGAGVDATGRWAVTGMNGGSLGVWDMKSSTSFAKIRLKGANGGAVVDPQRRYVAVPTSSGGVDVYGLKDKQKLHSLNGSFSKMKMLSLSPDGRFFAAVLGSQVLTFKVPAMDKVAGLVGGPLVIKNDWGHPKAKIIARHLGTISSLAYSPALKYVVVGGDDRHVLGIDLNGKLQIRHRSKSWGNRASVAVSADGLYAYASERKGLTRIDLKKKTAASMRLKHRARAVAVGPQGKRLLVGTYYGHLLFMAPNAKTKHLETKVKRYAHSSRIRGVAFSPLGVTVASASDDNRVRVWNFASQQKVWEARLPDDVNDVAFSPDGKELAAVHEDGKVRIFNAKDGTMLRDYKFGNFMLNGHSVAYRADGRVLAVGFDRGIFGLIDRKTHKIVTPKLHWGKVGALTWLPKGTILAGFGSVVIHFDPSGVVPPMGKAVRVSGPTSRTTAPKKAAPAPTGPIALNAVFSGSARHFQVSAKAGLFVIADGKGHLNVHQSASGKLVTVLSQAPAKPHRLLIDPVGRAVVAIGPSGQVYAWDLKTKKRTHLTAKGPAAMRARFAGALLILSRIDKTTAVFRMSPAKP